MNALRTRTLICALVMLAPFLAGRAEGQSLALSSAVVTFPNAGVAQLNDGGVEDAGVSVSVDPGGSQTNWTLYLRASSATLNSGGKSVSDMVWRLDNSTAWAALGTTDQAIASGVGPATVKVYLRTRLRWTADGPGTYGTDLIYSLTTS
jgi:hypothetical protein